MNLIAWLQHHILLRCESGIPESDRREERAEQIMRRTHALLREIDLEADLNQHGSATDPRRR